MFFYHFADHSKLIIKFTYYSIFFVRIIYYILYTNNIKKGVIHLATIAEIIGERIKFYRKEKGISQEKLSELAELHPTYIGQLERGEKNPSVESIAKICKGLGIPITQFLEKIDEYQTYEYIDANQDTSQEENYPLKSYELVHAETRDNQKLLYNMLVLATKYK